MLDFEGRPIPVEPRDSIASALFRAGVRVFSRPFRFRRPRGLYCMTGDCANCLVTVNGEPCVQACMTPAAAQVVTREKGWPSADLDLTSWAGVLRQAAPVGLKYRAFGRPPALTRAVGRAVRRASGIAHLTPYTLAPAAREATHHHVDLLVAGGGVAGLSAALAAASSGQTVLLADEGGIGGRLAPGRTLAAVEALAAQLREHPAVILLEQALVIGLYEGPLVPVAAANGLHLVHPQRIVVATGAVEQHPLFPGNDRVGVWLGRGAALLTGTHGLTPGARVVFVGSTAESLEHLQVLRAAGIDLVAVALPPQLADRSDAPSILPDATVIAATGPRLKQVTLAAGNTRLKVACDALVISGERVPRSNLLRQGTDLPVTGAGDVVIPGCTLDEAAESGRLAALGAAPNSPAFVERDFRGEGFVCLCEDVTTGDLESAWRQGYRSTELLKRYTQATTGPCQGVLCHSHLRAFTRSHGAGSTQSAATTARPPARPVRLEDVSAGTRFTIEHCTALHERHIAHGARMERVGQWFRPQTYGDTVDEYWAVRRDVSIMDVGTLGKFRVAGPDAMEFLERLYPCDVRGLADGRFRYALLLNEAGFVMDDGLVCSLGERGFYLTFTSSGAEQSESWLRDWADAWQLRVHIVNVTPATGAINLAGPRAQELLARVAPALAAAPVPFRRHGQLDVAGVPCMVLRPGFVGEVSYELHHESTRSVELWDALLAAGPDLQVRPHGLDALRLLRLEKGHILIGQDTDFDSTPAKLGLEWAVRMQKPYFVGKPALERMAGMPPDARLVQIGFEGAHAPPEGAVISVADAYAGYLTSSHFSPALGHGVALGWLQARAGVYAAHVHVNGIAGTIVHEAFYDPSGERQRG